MKLVAAPGSGERRRNLTTPGLGENTRPRSETKPEATQSPLTIPSMANQTNHEGRRSEAQPGDVVHHGDMVPEGEAQPDIPGELVLLEVHEGH